MLIYAPTIFLSAFLLFQIQPMIAKMILPWFGGSAAVWITAMLFFQVALLGGYLYAHWSIRWLRPRAQILVQAVLLLGSLALLPVMPSAAWKPEGHEDPILGILGILGFSVGLPYFLLSTTSPLLQAWFARKHKAAMPYRLFALSNLASLLGLLAYPFFVEPAVTLTQQSLGWSVAYGLFVLLGLAAAFSARPGAGEAPAAVVSGDAASPGDPEAPRIGEQILWLLLAACPSTLLLAVTNHLTQNMAAIPFLWVLPLGLYLLTFILCFDFERFYRRGVFTWLVIAACGVMAYGLVYWTSQTKLTLVIPAFSVALFIACLFFHGELVRRKPAPRYLTSFYLMLSIGGALGGLLVGLAAPKLLNGYFELPLALLASGIMVLVVIDYRASRLTQIAAWAMVIALFMAADSFLSSYKQASRVMVRNFYGGLRVQESGLGTAKAVRVLVHGTVNHGMQFTDPGKRDTAIGYYASDTGIGQAMAYLRPAGQLRVGIIGLGTGTLAAYAEPGDLFRFYEINPLVESLARTQFSYLADCRGQTEVILGDGRLSLEREPPQGYDLLVIDAFSGDAIPVHLLTTQALELYFRHLKPGGLLALHLTNTHLNLVPVVGGLARRLGKHGLLIANEDNQELGVARSTWAVLSTQPLDAPELQDIPPPEPQARSPVRVWTDDYSNLFQILKY